MAWFKRRQAAVLEPSVDEQTAAYRIELALRKLTNGYDHWWQYRIYDRKGKLVYQDEIVGEINEYNKRKALRAARRWCDNAAESQRLAAEAENYVEWYGRSPEAMVTMISDRDRYITELEERLGIGQHLDIQAALDADSLGA